MQEQSGSKTRLLGAAMMAGLAAELGAMEAAEASGALRPPRGRASRTLARVPRMRFRRGVASGLAGWMKRVHPRGEAYMVGAWRGDGVPTAWGFGVHGLSRQQQRLIDRKRAKAARA
jgi:hypothetical protein